MSGQDQTSQDQLQHRLEFEELITDTSAALVSCRPNDLDAVIEDILDRVRIFFGADRCALLTGGVDAGTSRVHLASFGPGVDPVSPEVDLAPPFPWSFDRLFCQGKSIRISNIDELPPAAAPELESWRQLPIRSALSLPLEIDGVVNHVILLNTVHRERDWPDAFVKRLRALGEMVVHAIQGQRIYRELQETEARLTLAADVSGAGLWTLDYGSGAIWSTERHHRVFGIPSDQPVTLELLESRVLEEDRPMVADAIDRAADSGEPFAVEYRIRRPEEEEVRWLSTRGRHLLAPDGSKDRLLGVTMDVTERRMVEEAHRLNKIRLESGADLAGLAFYEVDFGSGEIYVDERIRRLCGIPSEIDGGLGALDFWLENIHPEDQPRILRMREELHAGEFDEVSMEYRFLNPAQGERWIHHLARVAKRDMAGRSVLTHGVLRDITELRRTEEELRRLSQRLITAHEEERALLARELHDDLTQRLAVMAIDLGRTVDREEDEAQVAALQNVQEDLIRLSEDTHALSYHLHPTVLTELGLLDALRAETERRMRLGLIDVSLELAPEVPEPEKDAALCLFRVTQEALNNVARHANVQEASVKLEMAKGGFLLTVSDRGVGFDPGEGEKTQSLGLASIRERLRLVDGSLDISSAAGMGTTIRAWVPHEGDRA